MPAAGRDGNHKPGKGVVLLEQCPRTDRPSNPHSHSQDNPGARMLPGTANMYISTPHISDILLQCTMIHNNTIQLTVINTYEQQIYLVLCKILSM